jgi:hypothetical protein
MVESKFRLWETNAISNEEIANHMREIELAKYIEHRSNPSQAESFI